MVVAVQKQAEPAIRVDESRKYRVNAGQCDKCGYFKSWDFKITNPKTGKGLPGHVTKDGFKINDGDCPFYALIKAKTKERSPPTFPPISSGSRPRVLPPCCSRSPPSASSWTS
nr:hypothetical protein [Candidatus Sigynarchaeota archaeon]